VPLCWCSTPYKTTVHIVSGPEECRRLEQYIKGKASVPVVCYYED